MRIKTIAAYVMVGLIAVLGLVSSVSAFTSTGDGATINIENYYEATPNELYESEAGEEVLGAIIRPMYNSYDFKGGLTLSDDLIVDTDTLFVDVSLDRVGVNTSTPDYPFEIATSSAAGTSLMYLDTEGNLVVSGNITYGGFQTSTANPSVTTLTVTGSTTLNGGLAMDTSKFFVTDVTGLVGIGTSTPKSILHIEGGMNASSTLNIGNLGADGDPGDGRMCVYDSSVGYFIIATPAISASHVPSLAFTTSSVACD